MPSTPNDVGRGESSLRFLLWFGLYALAAGVPPQPTLDEDLWWHLSAGRWIVAHRAVPATDPFSRYGREQGTPWQAYSWLFEVGTYALYEVGGFPALVLGRCALALAVVAALHRLVGKRAAFGNDSFGLAALVTTLGLLTLQPMLTERPWLFTILFSAILLDLILDVRAGKRPAGLWLLPFLFALWANLHIQFIYGLFLLGLAGVAPLLDRLFRADDGEGVRQARLLLPLTGACAAATLATPYGFTLYAVVREYASQRVPLRVVVEMQAMGFRHLGDYCALALGGLAAFALGRRRPSAFDVLLLLTVGWLAFRARRDVWFLVLAAVAVVAPAQSGAGATAFLPRPRQAAAVAALVACALAAYFARAASGPDFAKALEASYPARATAFVRDGGLPGPLFNPYDWGGYLMWNLPELPVSMDGRANVHGDARLARAHATWNGLPDWSSDPDLASARLVIAGPALPLTSLLRLDQHFRVAYEDDVAVVFVRVGE